MPAVSPKDTNIPAGSLLEGCKQKNRSMQLRIHEQQLVNPVNPGQRLKGKFVILKSGDGTYHKDLEQLVGTLLTADKALNAVRKRNSETKMTHVFNRGSFKLIEEFESDPLAEIEQHRAELDRAPTATERDAVIKSRIGQGLFREKVIELWQSCAVTRVEDASLLRASHIKPWKVSSNRERLDPRNGLLLIPTIDHLFDRFLITFREDRSIWISSSISETDRERLGIFDKLKLNGDIPDVTWEHLKYHRSVFETRERERIS